MLVVAIMVKDEEKGLQVTLDSIDASAIDALVIHDTGSKDNTIIIARDWCDKKSVDFHCLVQPFEDFARSRNNMLEYIEEFARDDDDIILLLDANDQVRGDLSLLYDLDSDPAAGWMIEHIWSIGEEKIKFYNVNLIRSLRGWRYTGAVHEYITTEEKHEPKIINSISIFQDRTQNCCNTSLRFNKDYDLLKNELARDPDNPRTMFYLAQTCENIGRADEALEHYLARAQMHSFYEEVYMSFYRAGKLYRARGNISSSIECFLEAFEVCGRAEPLVELCSIYEEQKKWRLMYTFALLACQIEYPTTALLFIENNVYDYIRWHKLGIAAFYVGDMDNGREACRKAIEARELDIDKYNLSFYS